MVETFRSARFYFWPIIAANVLAMTLASGGDVRRMGALSLALCCLASFGFLVNDLCDRRIDLENAAGHFEHAMPSALATGRYAASAFCALGLYVAWRVGQVEFAWAVAIFVILAAYSPILRRATLVPNLVTAIVASSPLWLPAVLAPRGASAWQWWLIGAIVLILVAREILMDVRDRRGDEAGGRTTVATWLGPGRAVHAAWITTAVAVAPLAIAVLSAAREAPLLVGVAALGVGAIIVALTAGPAHHVSRSATADTAPAIRRYVLRSRLAMALVPALALLLSRST